MLNLVRNAMQSINTSQPPVENSEILLRTRVARNISISGSTASPWSTSKTTDPVSLPTC